MEIEIWSDVVCPFCYIGKKRFEQALNDFPEKDKVKITWRSFELDPSARAGAAGGLYQSLARKYGRDLEWAKGQSANVAQQAAEFGAQFDFDKAVPANTFDAHRLIHFANTIGKGDVVLESLFQAYFVEGADLNKKDVLVERAVACGISADAVKKVLDDGKSADEVRADEETARAFGLQGVPAFVINRKYLVSGAQPPEAFRKVLEKAVEEG